MGCSHRLSKSLIRATKYPWMDKNASHIGTSLMVCFALGHTGTLFQEAKFMNIKAEILLLNKPRLRRLVQVEDFKATYTSQLACCSRRAFRCRDGGLPTIDFQSCFCRRSIEGSGKVGGQGQGIREVSERYQR